MKKLFITILSISIFISGSNIHAEESSKIFEEDDCNCSISDMELTRTIVDTNGRGVECWFKKAPRTWIRPMKISLYNSAGEAEQAFDEQLIIPEPGQPGTYEGEKWNVITAIDNGLNYEIIEDVLSETRFSFIWRDNHGFQGRRMIIYKDIFILRIKAIDFESDTEIINTMNDVEACMKAVVDDKGSIIEEEPTEEILSGDLTISGNPLPYMYISLEYDGDTYETITDQNGTFNFSMEKKDVKEYELICHMKYMRDSASMFTIHMFDQEEYITIGFNFEKSEIRSVVIDLGSEGVHTLDTESLQVENIKFEDISNEYADFQNVGTIYLHSSEVIEFYKDHLGENIELETPVTIFTRLGDGVKYYHEKGKSWIVIDAGKTHYLSEYIPKCREYHELSHHAMRAIYGGEFPTSPPILGKDINHAGYKNPSTADSYVEGFAVFMSAIIGEYFNNWYAEDKDPCIVSPMGSLEVNINAWERGGIAEELAIAGVLWDLYDGIDQNVKGKESKQKLIDKFFSIMLHESDLDKDDTVTKKEFIVYCIYKSFNSDYHSQIDYTNENIDQGELATLISSIVIPTIDYKDMFTNDEINQFTNNINISLYDANTNGSWDSDEFYNYLTNEIYERGEDKIIFMNYDVDNNYFLDKSELESLAVGEAIRQVLNEDYDSNGNTFIAYEELKNLADWIEPHYRNSDASASEIIDKFENGMSVDKKSDLLKYINFNDDENVSIPFEDIWDILREKHNDFTSVYSSFITSFPDQKNAIDDIFKTHGFFADISPENKKWDKGEEIGRAANGSTSTRKARRSTALSPGQFIKVDNQIPFYNVTIVVFDGPLFLSNLTDVYTIIVQNEDGLVYLPIPPENSNAWISVEAADVETKNPVHFTSREFYNTYNETINQGYFLEYTFETKGDIPVLEISLMENDSKTNKNSPALDITVVLYLFVILSMYLYIRKRKLKQN